jgi:hypothetical protein
LDPLHAFPPNEDILQGIIEGMANMEGAGDVGGRNDDAIGPGLFRLPGLEKLMLSPVGCPFLLDGRWVVRFV